MHAPHLLDLEVAQALRSLERSGTLEQERAAAGLDDFQSLRVVRHTHTRLLNRAWALRQNLTVYDGIYIALAEALDAPLVTTDRRLASAPGHTAQILLCA